MRHTRSPRRLFAKRHTEGISQRRVIYKMSISYSALGDFLGQSRFHATGRTGRPGAAAPITETGPFLQRPERRVTAGQALGVCYWAHKECRT
jgi:hypothetical protein